MGEVGRMFQNSLAPFEFQSHFYSDRIIPKTRRSVSSPNPAPATPDVARAVYAAGPFPGKSALNKKSLVGRAILVLILAASATALVMDDEVIIHPAISWAIKLLLSAAFIVGVHDLGKSIRRNTWGAQRVQLAAQNGWLEYYPALVGEIWNTGTVEHEYDPTEYCYRAKARLFSRDGSSFDITTEAFLDNRTPEECARMGIAVVDDAKDAKFERVNGWYLAGHIATKPLSEAGFLHRLTESQVRAGITAALRA